MNAAPPTNGLQINPTLGSSNRFFWAENFPSLFQLTSDPDTDHPTIHTSLSGVLDLTW
ncbi:hypothetical protein [Moorena sp. SIO1F2]|uniref:hypothetical protein n=1 Tax=Moorena sp. SIO1F2 TaxID=2607819 RepID=UPI0025F97845|nr:hypothetical protein [Moorena sp. SIO1F2]